MAKQTEADHPAYVRPELGRVGTLESVTQGHQNGNRLDATFPVGTPKSQLTFS